MAFDSAWYGMAWHYSGMSVARGGGGVHFQPNGARIQHEYQPFSFVIRWKMVTESPNTKRHIFEPIA